MVITGTMDPTTVAAMVRTVCFSGAHRAYDPATTLAVAGTSTFNIGIEASLYKVPAAFTTAMSSMGGGSLAALPVLPIPRLHIRKGLGPKADLGLSAFFMGSTFRFYGGDLKFALTQPEEGPHLSFRYALSYSFLSLAGGWTHFPQLVLGRHFSFANPYIAVGGQYVAGTVSIVADASTPVILEDSATGMALVVFGGIEFNIPAINMMIQIEGGYHSYGMPSMGLKLGVKL